MAVNASNVRYLTFNDQLKYHKINNLRNLTITNTVKCQFCSNISANSHTCGSDAITFVGSMSSLKVTLTVCYNFGFLGFSLSKRGMGV